MKKLLAVFLSAVLALSLITGSASAAPRYDRILEGVRLGLRVGCIGLGCGFTDENGDGICDHYSTGHAFCGAAAGSGQCPAGSAQQPGCGFTDDDGDGVCDYYDANRTPHCGRSANGTASGSGNRPHHGGGRCGGRHRS